MKINFTPQRRDDRVSLHKSGNILTINEVVLNFNTMPAGSYIEASETPSEWLVDKVYMDLNNELEITLILPHGPNPPHEMAYPEPIEVFEDGQVTLPGDDIYPLAADTGETE